MRSIAEATKRIHDYAHNPDNVELAFHTRQRMDERGITLFDVLHILANGHILSEPEEADEPGHYKYMMCSRTPNSGSRTMCVIVIPSLRRPALKVITAMWREER